MRMNIPGFMRKGLRGRARALPITQRQGRIRAIFRAGALSNGLISVVFAVCADQAQAFFQHTSEVSGCLS